MAPKREAPAANSWLDAASDSEDDGRPQSDVDEADSRSRALKSAPTQKRRKLNLGFESDDDDDDNSDGDHNGDDSDDDVGKLKGRSGRKTRARPVGSDSDSDNNDNDGGKQEDDKPPRRRRDTKASVEKKAKAAAKAAARSGVVYISRIPPFMNVQDVRRLLSPYGTLGRLFLTPEDPESRRRRKRSGGSSRPCFTDGWVEFESKKTAKNVVGMLNTSTIGGSKRSPWHDDVWNLKYLTGFKWRHLTEQIANENAERSARLRAEIAHSTAENKMLVESIEKSRMVRGIEEKKKEKGEAVPEKKAFQTFAQTKVWTKPENQPSSGAEKIIPRVL